MKTRIYSNIERSKYMFYKSLGRDMTIMCTPTPSNLFDNRSCREKTGCTRECWPKKLKCQMCGEINSSLGVYEEVKTGKHFSFCYECEKTIKNEIVRN
jgi:hypothetical protein